MAITYITLPVYLPVATPDGQGRQWGPVAAQVIDGVGQDPPVTVLRDYTKRHKAGQPYVNRRVWGKQASVLSPYGDELPLYVDDDYRRVVSGATGHSKWDGRIAVWWVITPLPYYGMYGAQRSLYTWSGTIYGNWILIKQSSESTYFPMTTYDAAVSWCEDWYKYIGWHYDAILMPESLLYVSETQGIVNPADTPKFSERVYTLQDKVDLDLDSGRGVNDLVTQAYVDMVNHIPDLSGMGNAVNIIQLVGAALGVLRTILTGDISITVGSARSLLRDGWLAYRYSYGTTKADLEEVASYLNRAADLIDSDSVQCYGTAHGGDTDDEQLVRCSMEFGKSSLSALKSTIEKYGLQLDGYAVWDMVPYSFIVDWFLGIGDALEYARSTNFARRVKRQAWFSFERRWVNEFGFKEIYYRRWYGGADLTRIVRQVNNPSQATIVKRALDALALI